MLAKSKIQAPSPARSGAPLDARRAAFLYPAHLRFDGDGTDSDAFWFREDIHHPKPIYPFETIVPEAIKLAMGQVNTRLLAFPMSNGIDVRVHLGRVYFSPVAPPAEAIAADRAPVFERRTAYVFERFEQYEANWRRKVDALIDDLARLPLPRLDEIESDARALGGTGLSSGHDLCQFHARLVASLFQAYQYHFELLNISYLSLLRFSQAFEAAFPSADPATVNALLRMGDLELYEPHRQIENLARLAHELDVADAVLAADDFAALTARGGEARDLGLWYAALEAARADWFDYSDGIGFSYFDRVWNDNPGIVLDRIREAIRRGPQPTEAHLDPAVLLERSLALIADPEARDGFRAAHARARRVTPYLENHNLHIEHRFQSVFWRRLRDLGGLLHNMGWLDAADDVVLLDRWALGEMIFEAAADWAAGTGRGRPPRWAARLDEARSVMTAIEAAPPPDRFLGAIPDRIGDPIMICLFGVTSEAVADAGGTGTSDSALRGQGASAGMCRGPVHLVSQIEDFADAPPGAIVVCGMLPPSWCVSLSGIAGVVCEFGGVLSHAAILCREFGKPAVIGVADATARFRPGEIVEIDGTTGRIEQIEREA
ncbi:PEP-utilizing enzyme [Rhodophyticola sp.]|jgi:pyruvate,water dikinase|uniref:PEP-utilizing enzyme n=1 Tax=Rhodophyticola sp. TaxID=2680032 RepID=UPI003D26E1CB